MPFQTDCGFSSSPRYPEAGKNFLSLATPLSLSYLQED